MLWSFQFLRHSFPNTMSADYFKYFWCWYSTTHSKLWVTIIEKEKEKKEKSHDENWNTFVCLLCGFHFSFNKYQNCFCVHGMKFRCIFAISFGRVALFLESKLGKKVNERIMFPSSVAISGTAHQFIIRPITLIYCRVELREWTNTSLQFSLLFPKSFKFRSPNYYYTNVRNAVQRDNVRQTAFRTLNIEF